MAELQTNGETGIMGKLAMLIQSLDCVLECPVGILRTFADRLYRTHRSGFSLYLIQHPVKQRLPPLNGHHRYRKQRSVQRQVIQDHYLNPEQVNQFLKLFISCVVKILVIFVANFRTLALKIHDCLSHIFDRWKQRLCVSPLVCGSTMISSINGTTNRNKGTDSATNQAIPFSIRLNTPKQRRTYGYPQKQGNQNVKSFSQHTSILPFLDRSNQREVR